MMHMYLIIFVQKYVYMILWHVKDSMNRNMCSYVLLAIIFMVYYWLNVYHIWCLSIEIIYKYRYICVPIHVLLYHYIKYVQSWIYACMLCTNAVFVSRPHYWLITATYLIEWLLCLCVMCIKTCTYGYSLCADVCFKDQYAYITTCPLL